nr:MT-A70 family methyltransferase [Aurantimonas sp. CSK15Z-1]
MLVIDPPWPFELYGPGGAKKSASAHYQTMSEAQILNLPIGHLASADCLLYLWATATKLPLAIASVEAWGFVYRSFMIWRKTTASGRMRWGTGYRVRSSGELVVVATLGNPRQAYAPPTVFDGVAREHSRKPDEFYAICDRVMPHARRADVFARERRDGWQSFGDQVGKFGEAA